MPLLPSRQESQNSASCWIRVHPKCLVSFPIMKGGLPPNGSHHQLVPPRCLSGPRISNGISWNILLEKNNGLNMLCWSSWEWFGGRGRPDNPPWPRMELLGAAPSNRCLLWAPSSWMGSGPSDEFSDRPCSLNRKFNKSVVDTSWNRR